MVSQQISSFKNKISQSSSFLQSKFHLINFQLSPLNVRKSPTEKKSMNTKKNTKLSSAKKDKTNFTAFGIAQGSSTVSANLRE